MKKNLIIGLLVIVSLLSLSYGFVQKRRADEQEAIAVLQEKIAKEATIRAQLSQMEAERQREMALANERRAMEQTAIAIEQTKRKK